MHKFYSSSYDASIYLQQPEQNTGLDEILEIGKLYYGTSKDIARTFIKFDVSNIETGSGWRAFLNLKSANSSEIPLEYTIQANAIYNNWSMGTGTKFDNITSDGVSWYYKDGINKWTDVVGSLENTDYPSQTQGRLIGTTGSINNGGGGFWYSGSTASQSFNYEPDDVKIEVTNIIKMWLSGSISNNGFVLHHTLDAENDGLDYGVLKFFSKETNTIYEPKLEIVWDDSLFSTGSLTPVTGSAEDDYKVVITNLKTQYQTNSKIKIRVKGRDMYPLKSFGTGSFAYDQNKYLPSGSVYYQIEDYATNEIVVPFGNYSKLSCDSTSNYFNLDTSTYPINRTYKLKLKIVESGTSTIIDNKLIFEIV
jgi:hypothetical protein